MSFKFTYVSTFSNIAVGDTTGGGNNKPSDLFTIVTSSLVPIRLLWINLSVGMNFSTNTLLISVNRLTPTLTLGSGGTTSIPVEKAQISGRAASSTVYLNNTTRTTTSGTKTLLFSESFEELDYYEYCPTPNLFDSIPAGDTLIVGLEKSDNVYLNGSICWAEIA
jgi:hypothetical protein